MSHLDESVILKEYGGKIKNDLNTLLSSDDIDHDIDFTSLSPYVTIEQLPAYISRIKDNFSVLTLNCQCINAKFDDLYVVLQELLKSGNFNFSVINIQETWIKSGDDGSSPDVSLFNLPGYKTFALGASCSSKGGLLCYVLDSINAYQKLAIDKSNIWEGLFLDLEFDSTSLLIGNIYRPPRFNNNNQSIAKFISEFSPIVENISKDYKNVILCGDFNIDLLKLNEREKYAEFFDLLLSSGFLPKITFPTRFSKKSASLIDQIFVKNNGLLTQNSLSGIIHSPISDHYAAFTSLSFCQPSSSPKWVTVHQQDEKSLLKFKEAIASSNMISRIDKNLLENPNNTYHTIESEILKQKELFLPSKKVRFNKYKHKKNNWITSGIIKSIHFRDKLYHKLKSSCKFDINYVTCKANYDRYSKLLNKLIKEAKSTYYSNEFKKYSNNIKKTRAVRGPK